jgi:predicted O-methyltransferase YrrM
MLVIEGMGIERKIRDRVLELTAAFHGGRPGEGEELGRLLDVVHHFVRFAEELSHIDPSFVTRQTAQAAAVELRQQCQALLRLPRLSSALRSRIEAVADEQPAAVEGLEGYDFSLWVGFPHADTWSKYLAEFAGHPGVTFLEVGSFEGRSACWLLENVLTHPSSRLICVDVFEPEYVAKFDRNIARTGARERVVKKKGRSQNVLRRLPLDSFEAIYLDASSNPSDQLQDCVLAWPLLKDRGVLIVDDYGGGRSWEPGVSQAVDAFLHCFWGECHILHSDFQLMVRKVSAPP